MALNSVVVFALLGITVHYVAGQWGFDRFGSNRLGNNFGNRNRNRNQRWNPWQPPPMEYGTCIGLNTNGDVLRVTFSEREPDVQNWWSSQRGSGLDIDVFVRLGQNSNTQGTFQLVLTTFARVEDGCSGDAAGDIIDNNQGWFGLWGQNNNEETGRLGSSFALNRMTPGYISESRLEGMNSLREVMGRGVLMCPTPYIRNRRCTAPLIYSCCKVGRDSLNATSVMRTSAMGLQTMGMGGGNMMPGMQTGGMGGVQSGGIGNMQPGGMQSGGIGGGMQNGGMQPGPQMGGSQPGGGQAMPLLGLKKK